MAAFVSIHEHGELLSGKGKMVGVARNLFGSKILTLGRMWLGEAPDFITIRAIFCSLQPIPVPGSTNSGCSSAKCERCREQRGASSRRLCVRWELGCCSISPLHRRRLIAASKVLQCSRGSLFICYRRVPYAGCSAGNVAPLIRRSIYLLSSVEQNHYSLLQACADTFKRHVCKNRGCL